MQYKFIFKSPNVKNVSYIHVSIFYLVNIFGLWPSRKASGIQAGLLIESTEE